MPDVQLDWLTARPIAHRGLHDCGEGPIIENSVSAARAAIAGGFSIECDVQVTADGDALVFHDYDLDRLTDARGRVDACTAKDLRRVMLRGSQDRLHTLDEFLRVVDGWMPVVCEIKSRFDGDMRLAERAAQCAADYDGPICLESFDPVVVAHLRRERKRLGITHVPLGMVAQANYDDPNDEWAHLSAEKKNELANFLHFDQTQPDFLSYAVRDLPNAAPFLCRELGKPVTAWTVRTLEQRNVARLWADQIVFEGDLIS